MQEVEARVTEDGIELGRPRPAGNGGADVRADVPVRTPADVERLHALVQQLLLRNRQLEEALDSRIVIEQAKGILAERLSLDTERAFEVLRRASRNHRIKIHDLARRVVERRETPPEIEEILR